MDAVRPNESRGTPARHITEHIITPTMSWNQTNILAFAKMLIFDTEQPYVLRLLGQIVFLGMMDKMGHNGTCRPAMIKTQT